MGFQEDSPLTCNEDQSMNARELEHRGREGGGAARACSINVEYTLSKKKKAEGLTKHDPRSFPPDFFP